MTVERCAVRVRYAAGLTAGLLLLALAVAGGLAVGAQSVPPAEVFAALLDPDAPHASIVREVRVPRTLLAVAAGAALGLAGAVMQGMTRNPLADPGILGVNTGAACAVVAATVLLGTRSLQAVVWWALLGAAVAVIVVYLLGGRGAGRGTPEGLVLAGVAVTAVLGAVVSGLGVLDADAYGTLRMWSVGTLAGRELPVLGEVLPFLLIGAVLALTVAPALDAFALGDEAGRALGVAPGRVRLLGTLATVLLSGAATAAIGPVGFIGLVAPHVARLLTGPDHRRLMPYAVLVGAGLLLVADIVGRVIARPAEIQVGIVTAFVGAPVLIWLIGRGRRARRSASRKAVAPA
ncbi:iron chelate uptake ABC transporter family permease subunit [Streptomyces sp. SID8356]|uniref:FecCD family ABC transporter permease n=1 Tax=unclassified Streptomyces TaxID=2593676 RepID=UPI0003791AF3|nr:iron ABC transporter permease [Streptomyces sp. CcalMP-8W]MYT40186.1 iron chelate uptake ABC transporter family permease subunit [Streptomyces sp. SID8356]